MLYNIRTKIGGVGMQCMKCGQEIAEGSVFCDACLEVMEKYPVKPGTPVNITPRKPTERSQRKHTLSTEDLLAKQLRLNRRLKLLALALAAALAFIAVVMLLWTLLPGYDVIPGVKKPF